MKKILFILMLIPLGSWAQTNTENYILTKTYKVASTQVITDTDPTQTTTSIQYFDGLGRAKQSVILKGGGGNFGNNDVPLDWSAGTPNNNGFYNLNGSSSENKIINGTTPFGDSDLLWECKPDASNNSDGGWNSDYFAIDKTKTYRYSVWVKRTGSQHGTTYHGIQLVNNLSGSANNNPYFWAGDLPTLNTWYLMVGVVHPNNYSGGDTGVSGVYDTNGNKVKDGIEFKWQSNTTQTRVRNYLYYSTNTSVRQYFWSPVFQKMDGLETPLDDIIASTTSVISNEEIHAKDIVTHYQYDEFGRQTKEYLPYAAYTDGAFSLLAGEKTQEYYLENYEDDFEGITKLIGVNAYSEKGFDNSPLNRVLQQAVPGEDWKIERSNTIQFAYQTNLQDEVYQIKVSFTDGQTDAPSLDFSNSRYYNPNTLYKTITKDENWQASDGKNHTTEEFKNKQGQVVLKATYANTDLNNDGDFNETGETQSIHSTYYVYDDFGNLTYVIPPKVNLTNGVSSTELSELCYQYKYDNRNRLIEKKIPGKDWEYIVYDKLDRPVLTQDAVQKTQQKWNFTKYDNLGRVAYTGIFTSYNTRSQMQSQFDAVNNSTLKLYETKISSGSGFDGTYYTNSNFPYSNLEVLTVNYYDNYTFNRVGAPTSVNVYGVNSTTNLKSLATGSRIKVLDQSPQKWITTVTYYDEKARPIYVHSKNEYLNTIDIVESKLDDFTGKVLETKTTHKKGTNNDDTIITIDSFTYDHQDRLISQKQKINDQISERIVKNNYDDLGQLKSKLVGNGAAGGYTNITSGISLTNDIISKTSSSGWNTGLATIGKIEGNGYASFSPTSTNKWYMVGLSSDNTNASYNTIDFAAYISGSDLRVYESGSHKGYFGRYSVGDVIKVERIGNKIYYKKNDVIFYTSLKSSSGILLGDISIHSAGTQIKNFHIIDNSKGLQNVDYDYNVRGWLTNINDVDDIGNDLFTFKLNYNTTDMPGSVALFNGNISETLWKSNIPSSIYNPNSDKNKGYGYHYDALNRITKADFKIKQTSSAAYAALNYGNYNLKSVSYDKNGNIKALSRSGNYYNEEIDKLTYTIDSGNKLLAVKDEATTYNNLKDQGFKDGNTSGNDYVYDANGNMIKDLNKGISAISYNHLNLPTYISFYPSQYASIRYVYSADGTKLKKTVEGYGIPSTTTEYAGNYIYENNTIQFFNHAEGYNHLENDTNKFEAVYQYKDHLGSVRLSYSDTNNDGVITASSNPSTNEIIEESIYYPFGLKHKGYNNNISSNGNSTAQKYMYNQGTSGKNFQGKEGKSFKVERQEELGLNVDMTKFRMYDYALGRFLSIDPLADANPQESWTPYQYAYNSPIQYNDPYGDCPSCFGALVGALVDVAVQAIEISLDDTKSAKDFSWSSVGVSAAAGATGVGLVSKLKKVGTLGKLAVEASLDAAASAGTQFAKDGEVDLGDVAIDVIGGQTAGKVAGDFAESKFLKSNKGKKLQEGINQQKNAKRGKSNTISKSKADVKGAENKLTRAAAARGVGASTAASGAASTGVTEATKKIEDDKKE